MKDEKLKMYVGMEDLSEYEKEHQKISFKRLFNKLFTNAVLCNNIIKLFYTEIHGKLSDPEFIIGTDYDKENDEDIYVYQYFIVDFNEYTYSKMEEYAEQLGNEFILYYIAELDMYIVGVTHWGTSWDYVLTDIEPTENLKEANL